MSMQQKQLTENELDAIYKYLSLMYENMNDQEKLLWTSILSQYDPEFDDIGDDDT